MWLHTAARSGLEVLEGSDAARRAGIERGMVLIAVNGLPPLKRFLQPEADEEVQKKTLCHLRGSNK